MEQREPAGSVCAEEDVERVVACLTKTRVNTFPLCACLRACLDEAPYRDIEARLEAEDAARDSTQTPHVLIGLLVEAGGIRRTPVEESARAGEETPGEEASSEEARNEAADIPADRADDPAGGDTSSVLVADDLVVIGASGGEFLPSVSHAGKPRDEEGASAIPGGFDGTRAGEARTESDAVDGAPSGESASDSEKSASDLVDQPTDYTLVTTDAGRAALELFEPGRLIAEFMGAQPPEFFDVACRILALCEEGAALSAITEGVGKGRITVGEKSVYPEYFVSRLENAGAIEWEGGRWRATEPGRAFSRAHAQTEAS